MWEIESARAYIYVDRETTWEEWLEYMGIANKKEQKDIDKHTAASHKGLSAKTLFGFANNN